MYTTQYCPDTEKMLKVHMVQNRQGVRSTNTRTAPSASKATPTSPTIEPTIPNKKLHTWEEPIIKIYTDDMGHIPIRYRSGNLYLMLFYHCNCNDIRVDLFRSKQNSHRLTAYNNIRRRQKKCGHKVNLQVLDNKSGTEYLRTIKEECTTAYQRSQFRQTGSPKFQSPLYFHP